MHFVHATAVKSLVWLVALVIPAEAMPRFGCSCAQASSTVVSKSTQPRCPHCAVPIQQPRTCCQPSNSAQPGRSSNCCCHQKNLAVADPCGCGNAQPTNSSTPVTSNPADALSKHVGFDNNIISVIDQGPPGYEYQAAHPADALRTVSERLSTLCRLVI